MLGGSGNAHMYASQVDINIIVLQTSLCVDEIPHSYSIITESQQEQHLRRVSLRSSKRQGLGMSLNQNTQLGCVITSHDSPLPHTDYAQGGRCRSLQL